MDRITHSRYMRRNKKAQLTQMKRATMVHVWRPTANQSNLTDRSM